MQETPHAKFGSELRRLRNDARRTLKDLAKALECTVPHVSDIERGRRSPPGPRKLAIIAQCLNLSEREFFRLEQYAAEHRGVVDFEPESDESRETLVALRRKMDSGDKMVERELRRLLGLE